MTLIVPQHGHRGVLCVCPLCGRTGRHCGRGGWLALHLQRNVHIPCPFGCGSYVGLKMHMTRSHELVTR